MACNTCNNFNNSNNINGITSFNNFNNMANLNNSGCPCQTNSSQEAMLTQIRQLRFSINDLTLYLDTHPYDRRALVIHNEYSRELRSLTNSYQRMYGPLDIECPCNQWRWIDEPWPWERS
jgi:spore coat protein JB